MTKNILKQCMWFIVAYALVFTYGDIIGRFPKIPFWLNILIGCPIAYVFIFFIDKYAHEKYREQEQSIEACLRHFYNEPPQPIIIVDNNIGGDHNE